MIICPVCGESVTEQEEVCSNCGHQLKPQSQKITTVAPPVPPTPIPPIDRSSTVETNFTQETVESSIQPISTMDLAQITLKRGGVATTQTFSIQGTGMVIGRFDADSGPVDIDLGRLPEEESEYISRYHARIWRETSGQWFIEDLGAKNGTFFRATGQAKFQRVNGKQALNNGDEIAFGNVQFEFRVK